MKYCAKCGATLDVGQDVCSKCGYDLTARQSKAEADEIRYETQVIEKDEILSSIEATENIKADTNDKKEERVSVKYSEEVEKEERKRFSGKTKMAIAAVAAAVVLLIGLYNLGNFMTKPSKVVAKFEKAVASDNKEELAGIIYSDDNRLEINEKNIAPLISYFKDNPSYLNTVTEDLNKQVMKIEGSKGMFSLGGGSSQNTLSIVHAGKKFIFFPNYKIGIKPAFIQVKTGIKDVAFSLNSTDLGKSDSNNFSKEFGPFIPGKYKLLANYKGKYVTLSDPHDVDLVASNSGKVNLDVFNNLNYINIRSEYPDAVLFVNGKDTGVKVADAQNFGPLSANTKVYATVNKNGKALKSSEYTVSQGDLNINLDFGAAESTIKNIEGQIHDLIYWYTYGFTQAVNSNSFYAVEDYIYPGSKLYNEQKSYVPSTYSQGIRETIMSFNILSYTVSEDNKSGTINTEEVYNINKNGSESVKSFKYKYTFKYNEAKGGYQLDSIASN